MELKDQLDQMGRVFEEFKSHHKQEIEELKKKPAADPLLTEKMDRMSGDVVKLMELQQKVSQIQTALNRPGAGGADEQKADPIKEAKHEYDRFLRRGEIKALTDQTDAEGGYLIRPEVSNEIVRAEAGLSVMRQLCNVRGIGTDSIEVLSDNGDFQAAWVGEIDARPETGTPTLAPTSLLVHEIYAKPHVSQKMLDDAFFNVEAYVNEKIASAFAAKEDLAFLSGTGTGQPKGVLAYAAGTGAGQIEDVNTGQAAALSGDAFISAVYSLPPSDIGQASIVMLPAAVSATLKLKDSQGGYLWNMASLREGQPATLVGRPVYLDSNLQAVSAGNYPAVVGNFKRAYMILDRVGIRMLRDPYTTKPYVQFYATKRVGGGVVAPKALKRIKVSV